MRQQQPAISVCLASNMSAVCDTSPTAPIIVLDATNLFHPPGNSGAKSRVESDNG